MSQLLTFARRLGPVGLGLLILHLLLHEVPILVALLLGAWSAW